MLREQVVDKRLVAQSSSFRFPTDCGKNSRVDPNRDYEPFSNQDWRQRATTKA
jgi:hypothetical protein